MKINSFSEFQFRSSRKQYDGTECKYHYVDRIILLLNKSFTYYQDSEKLINYVCN